MKYKIGEFEAQHNAPAWKEKANFIFAAHIGSEGNANKWEQLWGCKKSSRSVILCCIPFFAYNINLGDELSLDDDYNVSGIITRSSQLTFRIWMKSTHPEALETVMSAINANRLPHESYSARLMSVSAHTAIATKFSSSLIRMEEDGLINFETGMQ